MCAADDCNEEGVTRQDYDAVDAMLNLTETIDQNGNKLLVIGPDYQNGMWIIHSFVDRVGQFETEPAHWFIHHDKGVRIQPSKQLGGVPSSRLMTEDFKRTYELSEHVKLFLECEKAVGLDMERRGAPPYTLSIHQPGKRIADLENQLVDMIRSRVRTPQFRRAIAIRRYEINQNFERGKRYIEALFERYSRLNVIRIDLMYKAAHFPTFEQIKGDFNRFLNNRRRKTFFKAEVGLIWRLEFAPYSGFHYHLIVFTDGSRVGRDILLATRMGEFWSEITGGRGRFHNCNQDQLKYPRRGIGSISHNDVAERHTLVNEVLRYLTKTDELARPPVPKGARTFDCTQPPAPHSGKGRKRKASE